MNSDNGFLTAAGIAPSAIEVAETCHKIPALLPLRTRCGKAGCRCTKGHLHAGYWVLRWREGTKNRRRYVRREELAAVRAALERRRRQRAAERLAFMTDLALLRRLEALRRELNARLSAGRRDR